MDEARREILARLRASARPAPEVHRGYRRRLSGMSRADVVALFAERVADYRGTGSDDLAMTVAAALWAREAKRIVVPADLPYGWLAELDGVRALADVPQVDAATLAEVDAVVTGCAAAVAETGSVVLDGGRAQGRRALTLVPGHHLCVVHADQIVGTVPEAIARLDPYRPLTWLTAPAEGRTFEVLVVED